MHGSDYKLRITQAVQEAFSDIRPKPSPSGAHAIFVVGQLVVNVHDDSRSDEFESGKCCKKCHH